MYICIIHILIFLVVLYEINFQHLSEHRSAQRTSAHMPVTFEDISRRNNIYLKSDKTKVQSMLTYDILDK